MGANPPAGEVVELVVVGVVAEPDVADLAVVGVVAEEEVAQVALEPEAGSPRPPAGGRSTKRPAKLGEVEEDDHHGRGAARAAGHHRAPARGVLERAFGCIPERGTFGGAGDLSPGEFRRR